MLRGFLVLALSLCALFHGSAAQVSSLLLVAKMVFSFWEVVEIVDLFLGNYRNC